MITTSPKDVGDALKLLFKDTAWIKQRMGSPQIMGMPRNPEFDTITFPGNVVLDVEPPGAVQNIIVVPGTYYDQIFADVTWSPNAVGGESAMYDVELAKVLAGPIYDLVNVVRAGGTDIRLDALEPSTNYAVRITAVNPIGIQGASSAWTAFTTGQDTTVPPAPTGVIVARGATTVIVKYTPLTKAQAADVANGHGIYEIEIDTSSLFNTGNFRSMRSADQIVAFNDIFSEATWHARVRAIDASGNVGPWSSSSSGFAGAVIDSMIVAGLDAAKITVGFLSASRLEAGTIAVDKLTTSTLTSANITINGGSLRVGSPPTTGLLINSQGLRLYSGGVAKVILGNDGTVSITGTINADNGTFTGVVNATGGTFTGTINGGTFNGGVFKTAASGTRIEMSNFGASAARIVFYSGSTEVGRLVADPTGIEIRNQVYYPNSNIIVDQFVWLTSPSNVLFTVDGSGTFEMRTIDTSGTTKRYGIKFPDTITFKAMPNLGNVLHIRNWADNGYAIVYCDINDTSGAHLKENIEMYEVKAIDALKKTKLRKFDFKDDPKGPRRKGRVGLLADEMPPEIIQRNDDGEPEAYAVGGMIGFLVKAVQELQEQIDTLKA